eukprot:GHVU01229822.1.p1 GENE.GHVU01229822.1~~GHVU01229822.1.p1  ORF type:complete len:163 (+),score=34.18 GHVU01229822.1:46-534(+)
MDATVCGEFSEQQIGELRDAFNIFDKDGDGSITTDELHTVMMSLRQSASADDIREMIKQVDIDGNGTVDFEEFLKMMSRSKVRLERCEDAHKKTQEEEMRQAFRVFDIDGNGYIDATELRTTMNNLGECLSEEDVKAMIREADTNGDGRIDYEEFIRMMYNK